jgi:TPR repeat protein
MKQESFTLLTPDTLGSQAQMYRQGKFGEPDLGKAKRLYEQAVEKGDAGAMFNLAQMYRRGEFGEPDLDKAKGLYEQAVDKGHAGAMNNLAQMYRRGDFGEPDLDKAKGLYEQAVDKGHAGAMNNLALMYMHGEFGEPDLDKAKELYEQAVDKGHAGAMNNLALMYTHGEFGEPDLDKANGLYEQAVEKGDAGAMFNLAQIYRRGEFGEPDLDKAKGLYEQAVDKGHAGSMFNLALMYTHGEFGEPDLDKAKGLYEQAVEKGDVSAMFNLAQMYRRGEFGEPDLDKAKGLYEQAVEKGHAGAMNNLALMYRRGDFGEPDLGKAKGLYEQAVDKGHAGAMFNLALMYRRGEFGEPDLDKAKGLYEQAVDKGDANSMFNLALMYRTGDLGEPDKPKAQELFSTAAKMGHLRAASYLPNPMIQAVLKSLEIEGVEASIQKRLEFTLESLEEVFFEVRSAHLITDSIKLAHFTTWPAIESILQLDSFEGKKNCLRQYLVEYMNDPSEGQRLLRFSGSSDSPEVIGAYETSKLLRQLFDKHYFGSFDRHTSTTHLLPSVFTVSLTKESDRLDLWRAYGRDGQGFCLVLPITHNGDSVVHMRNRDSSLEFLTEEGDISSTAEAPSATPLLYWIRYSDEDVARALTALASPLKQLLDLQNELSVSAWDQVASCSTAILLELLYLYKDEQYSTEKEARSLTVMRLDNPRIQLDERNPGHLFCETPAFLFKTSGSEIILGPKVQNPIGSLWNIRYRLTQLDFADNTIVRCSNVPYR